MVAAIEGALTKQTEPNRRACGRIGDMPDADGCTPSLDEQYLRKHGSLHGNPRSDVPEELLVRAKKRAGQRAAADQLRFLVTEGLRGQIAGPQTPARRRRIRWVTAARRAPAEPRSDEPRAHARLAAPPPVIAVDTNLLVYAHRHGLAEHRGAQRAIERASVEIRGDGASAS